MCSLRGVSEVKGGIVATSRVFWFGDASLQHPDAPLAWLMSSTAVALTNLAGQAGELSSWTQDGEALRGLAGTGTHGHLKVFPALVASRLATEPCDSPTSTPVCKTVVSMFSAGIRRRSLSGVCPWSCLS